VHYERTKSRWHFFVPFGQTAVISRHYYYE
jgi:hypothetical protein